MLKSSVDPLANNISFVDKPICIVSVQTLDTYSGAGDTPVWSGPCVIFWNCAVAFCCISLVG